MTAATPYAGGMTKEGEETLPTPDVVVRGNASGFLQDVTAGTHHFRADEPASVGGNDSAPDPYDYLLAGLGACTSMTLGLYARKRKWPLEDVTVALRRSRIHARDCADCDTKDGLLDHVDVEVTMTGPLTEEQRATLMTVAHKCPVHRSLKSEIKIGVRPAAEAPASAATN